MQTSVVSNAGKLERLRRLLPSFPVLLAAVLLMVTCFTVRDRFNDLDLWWHLKAGELISKTHALPKSDPFSYSAPKAQWVTQEWLSEVSIYQAYAFAGNPGLALWLFAFASAIVLAGYGLCLLCCGNPRIAFLGGMLIWLFSTIGLAIRPHMVGYLLLTAELVILNLALRRRTRWLYALPVLFLLWVNLHSSFFLGFVVLAMFVACSLVPFKIGYMRMSPLSRAARRTLLAAFGISALALFVNPVGLKLLRYPLEVLFAQPLSATHVLEWAPPNLNTARGFALILVSVLIVALPIATRKWIYGHELALFFAGFWLAMRHQRMLFVFGIFAAPTLCRLVGKIARTYQPAKDRILINAAAFATICILLVRLFPESADLQEQINRDNPVEALAFIRNASLTGPMMNDYDFGGYLIWAAPERKVFIDGRSDMYEPAGVMAEYTDWIDLRDSRNILDKYKVSYCLLGRKARITAAMMKMPGWKQLYADNKAVVLARQN